MTHTDQIAEMVPATDQREVAPGVRLDHVEIVAEPGDQWTPAGFSVCPVWTGVDRPDSGGWLVKNRPIALRLAAALIAHKAITVRGILTDVNGKTYVDTQSHVLGRMLNADLRRLGF